MKYTANMPIIIAGFPGCGKSHYTHELVSDKRYSSVDSDSSEYHWSFNDKNEKIVHPEWPMNYLNHILNSESDICFISTHREVRSLLHANSIPVILVYPDQTHIAEEYVQRFVGRQHGPNDEKFVQLIIDKWDNFLSDLHSPMKDASGLTNEIQIPFMEKFMDLDLIISSALDKTLEVGIRMSESISNNTHSRHMEKYFNMGQLHKNIERLLNRNN